MGHPRPSEVDLEGPRHRGDTRSPPSREPPLKIAVSKIYRNDTCTLKVSGPTLSRPSSAIVQERIYKIQREQKTRADATAHATQAEKGCHTRRQKVSGPFTGGDHEEVVGPIFPPLEQKSLHTTFIIGGLNFAIARTHQLHNFNCRGIAL